MTPVRVLAKFRDSNAYYQAFRGETNDTTGRWFWRLLAAGNEAPDERPITAGDIVFEFEPGEPLPGRPPSEVGAKAKIIGAT